MPLKTWNGSSFVAAKTLRVWNGSSWVSGKAGNVWNGSSWVRFFSGTGTASIDPHTIEGTAVSYNDNPSSGISRLTLTTSRGLFGEVSLDGDEMSIQMDLTDYGFSGYENVQLETWLSADGDPSLWSCRAVPIISSPAVGSSATNTWLPMTSEQSWYLQAASNSFQRNQSKYFQFTLELALTADTSTVLASALMQLAVTAQTQAGDIP